MKQGHRSNTRAGKAPLPAHNRKAGQSAVKKDARWRFLRRRMSRWLKDTVMGGGRD